MKQTIRITGVVVGGLLMLALLAACAPGGAKTMVPTGVAKGQATFLYFYTET